MYQKLAGVESRFEEISRLLSDPRIISDQKKFQALMKERSSLEDLVSVYREYKSVKKQLDENRAMLAEKDDELRSLAKSEIDILEPRLHELDQKLRLLLLPKDPRDEKNVILEIRPGAGGDEAGIFVTDLFRMYQKYAERNLEHGLDRGRGFKGAYLLC